MHQKSELSLIRVEQFKRDRWPFVIGQLGATGALVGLSWPTADHQALISFAVVHHISTWILAFTFFAPFRSNSPSQIPMSTFVGTVICNATLSSALLFDLTAARNLDFALATGAVLFAGASGSFVTLGEHPTLLRVSLASLLLPFAVITLALGHIAIALGVTFFFCNVVITGVWKTARGNQQLIEMRIAESERAALAEMEAETDPLTKLMNRRGVQRLDGKELEAGAAAMYFDVNEFKAINDTCGHAVGDEVLRVVAQHLRDNVPARDVVARIGGDEFLVLSFTDDTLATEALVERLNEHLRQPIAVSGGEVLQVSIAVGVSYTSAPWLQLTDLLRDSDRDMYRSKKAVQNSDRRDQASTLDTDLGRSAA